MAINIVKNIPQNSFLPGSNPVNMTVSSTNNSQCDFRYVADAIIDDVNVFRFKLFPEPSTGFAYFQLSDVINEYLSSYKDLFNNADIKSASSPTEKTIVKVSIRFGEEYDISPDCGGDITTFPNLATSNTFYCFLGAQDYENWPTFDFNDYLVDYTTPGKKFLTDKPRDAFRIGLGDSEYLDFLSNSTPDVNDIFIRVTIGSNVVNIPFTTNFTSDVRRFRIACGPLNINRALTFSAINTSVKKYSVGLYSLTNGYVSEIIDFNLEKFYEYRTRLGFVSRFGSNEHITFFHRNRETYDIDRRDFDRFLTSRKGNDWTYDVGDRRTTTYSTDARINGVVSTFVGKKTSNWLSEMWLTNDLWIEDRPRVGKFVVNKEILPPCFQFTITNNSTTITGTYDYVDCLGNEVSAVIAEGAVEVITARSAVSTSINVSVVNDGAVAQPERMLFRMPDGHGLKPGMSFFGYPDNNPDFADYNQRFTVVSVDGNIVDCGILYSIFNLTEKACGYYVIDEPVRAIPIVPIDTSVEIRQRLERPIEYTLSYTKSVEKITLRR